MNHYNELPPDFTSWFAFLEWLKKTDMPTQHKVIKVKVDRYGSEPMIYDIELDYAKARAFEGIGEIPDAVYLHKVQFGYDFENEWPEFDAFLDRLIDLRL